MAQPTLPVLIIGLQDYGLEVMTTLMRRVDKITLSGFWTLQSNKAAYYDSQGKKWQYVLCNPQPNFERNWWRKLIVGVIYNPWIQVEEKWELIGNYAYDELKQWVIQCIQKDDDILTQYVEADYLIKRVEQTSTFEQLMDVLNKFIFEIDEEQLAKEFDWDKE